MIESVQIRQRGAYDFDSHYDNLCAMQDSCPLPAVKAHLAQGVLDINGDRVRVNDWAPILNTIKINKSLEFIAVRSYYSPPSEVNEKKALIEKRKMPSIRSKEITYRLCKVLKECLMCTPNLACLELQGLPLRERDLQTLIKGLAKNETLNHLSVEFCRIGDGGLEVLCKGIKNQTSISSINLTGCSLSSKGSDALAKVIKHQAMKRHNEAWRDSLRYRRPDLDRMPGIRRITINNNPMLGDQGAALLAEALKDDLWLKALDLQSCGISTEGARQLLDVLKYNTTIVVLDVRRNPLIDRDVVHSIMEQLMINCNGQDTEYKWIKAEEGLESGRKKKRRTKTLNCSFGRKTTIRVSAGAQRRRTKSASSLGVTHKIQPISSEGVKSGPGMPWRTAARANRYRGFPPEHIPGKASLFENSEASPTSSPDHTQSILINAEDEEGDTLRQLERLKLDDSNLDTGVANIKELQIELIQVKRKMQQEKLARARSDKRVVELTLENKRLKDEVLKQKGQPTSNVLDDDKVLESIEASFKQFHQFLDLLREAGLGQLITMAGLDHKESPFSQGLAHTRRTSQKSSKPLHASSPSKIPIRPTKPTMKSPYFGDISAVGRVGSSTTGPKDGENIANLSAFDKKFRDFHDGSFIDEEKYTRNIDPTMEGEYHDGSYDKGPMRKDDLYERILQETSGMFSHVGPDNSTIADILPVKDHGHSEKMDFSIKGQVPKNKAEPETNGKKQGDVRKESKTDLFSEDYSHGLREEILQDLPDFETSETEVSELPSRPKPQPRGRKLSDDDSKARSRRDNQSEKDSPEHKSKISDYNYSMDSFEQSYFSERGELVQDLNMLESGASPSPEMIDSENEDF
ncbi:centrosomal protein of 78 kDa-like [Ostrea edulis]|uniref:centrosomal protein of 78 kDa-like n=1 Tax=Ostrea edulis TaxID=37623 RepID=UPI002095E4FE|nr:centrosomal protein of 78 kDa-like [Ostrea edulis]